MNATRMARLRWRCRRGMRELDVLLMRYLEREYPEAAPARQRAFDALLSEQDPDIVDLLAGRVIADDADRNHVVERLLAQSRG